MTADRVRIICWPLHSTHGALCVAVTTKSKDREVYLPYALIEDKEYDTDGMLCSLTIPRWLAKAKKLL